MELSLYGTMPRKMAETFVKDAGPSPEELALAQQSAQNDAMALQQNQQAYEANPIPYEVDRAMQSYSPDEIDTTIKELSGTLEEDDRRRGNPESDNINLVDMESQDGGIALENTGAMTSDLGSMLANPNSLVL